MALLVLLASCSEPAAKKLPEDAYQRALICVSVLSTRANALMEGGKMPESLRYVAALANAEKRRNDITAALSKTAEDVTADSRRVLDALRLHQTDRTIVDLYTSPCLADYEAR